jgi:hypothetical protein
MALAFPFFSEEIEAHKGKVGRQWTSWCKAQKKALGWR